MWILLWVRDLKSVAIFLLCIVYICSTYTTVVYICSSHLCICDVKETVLFLSLPLCVCVCVCSCVFLCGLVRQRLWSPWHWECRGSWGSPGQRRGRQCYSSPTEPAARWRTHLSSYSSPERDRGRGRWEEEREGERERERERERDWQREGGSVWVVEGQIGERERRKVADEEKEREG